MSDPQPRNPQPAPRRTAQVAPALRLVQGDPAAGVRAPRPAGRKRPLLVRWGKHLRAPFDRLIARSSILADDPVLDVRDFAWTALLRENWQAIRDEAVAVALGDDAAPSLVEISPDHRAIARMHMWKSFFLWGYDYPVEENLARCPATATLVSAVPGMATACFSILAPGTHIPAHRGVTKGLITCHLGLVIPQDGDARLRLGDRVLRWAEGETLVFDDTCDHEVWNDTRHSRVVLLIQFRRPLRQPGRTIAELFLSVVKRSAFVQEARANLARWNAAHVVPDHVAD